MLLHFSGSERQYNDAKIKKLKTFNLDYKTYMYILYQVFLKVVVCVLFLDLYKYIRFHVRYLYFNQKLITSLINNSCFFEQRLINNVQYA